MYFLKLTFLALVLFQFNPLVLSSSDETMNKTVGKQPLKIIFDQRLGLHIFCGGLDLNYDGIINESEGDEFPSWWTAATQFDPEKSMNFDFSASSGLGFPFVPGYDPGHSKDGYDSKLYVFQDKWLMTYRMYDQTFEDSLELNDPISAIYYYDETLYLSRSVLDGGHPHVYIKDISEKNYEYKDTLVLEIRPRQMISFESSEVNYLAVIDEGNFGSDDSKLFIFELNETHDFVKSFDIGNTANHIAVSDKYLIVTVNGSSNVILIDKETMEISKTIPIPVSNTYNGPREVVVGNYKTFISTYDGKIFVLDLESGELESDLTFDGKAEGMAYDYYFDYLYVASAFKKDSYDADSKYVIYMSTLSIDSEYGFDIEIFPNPSADIINISLPDEIADYQISLIDMNGRTVVELNNIESNNNSIRIDMNEHNLTSGSYYVVVETEKFMKAVPIIFAP